MIAVDNWEKKSTDEKLKFLLDHIIRLDSEATAIRYKLGPIETEIGSLNSQLHQIRELLTNC